ncbi:EAL domain-containing protein (plasmid) [Paroceanicella profunda]|uniref:EAL domain-containing protein n=1 Tax=Paroceanicella profunda TaxID=2579971 RepID=A0A5B8G5L9_9RHOB|nr:EAL domain-containing protein [Paroceanicella profunda]QDL94642.1 EAL domain-containing protein [Paroceanicella profunda]
MARIEPLFPRRDEAGRLAALHSYLISEDYAEAELGRFVDIARRALCVPMAALAFVGETHQYVRAPRGTTVRETRREGALSAHALGTEGVFEVPDARADPRFRFNPMVTGAPHIRFFAAAVLRTPEGWALGTLSVCDTRPRPNGLTEAERLTLSDLAELVMARMEATRAATRQRDPERLRFEQMSHTSPDGIICADDTNHIRFWSAGAERMFGYSAEETLGRTLDMILPEALRGRRLPGLARALAARARANPERMVSLPALRRDGTEFPVELSLSSWQEDGRVVFGAILRDITARRRTEAELRHAAEHDPLTGLANRALLRRRMEMLNRTGRGGSVMMLDLDGFKHVNDVFGHAGGDHLLVTVAERLTAVSDGALVARLGGDEFVLLIEGEHDVPVLRRLAERVVTTLAEAVPLDNHVLHVGASVGVAHSPPGMPLGDLLGDADLALYRAKSSGRGRVMFFETQMRTAALNGGTLVRDLHGAWARREFELHFQPQFRLADRALVGVEALLRWNHPERGELAPEAFLAGLESSMLAAAVGDWVLDTACSQLAAWRASAFPGLRMSVNLFPVQLHGLELADRVAALLDRHGLPGTALELEVKEAAILRHRLHLSDLFGRLRALGVGVAFDDFGTGLASLRLLRDVPLSCLTIDRAAISGAGAGLADPSLVEAVVGLASGFGLQVVAEGIETEEQARRLRAFGGVRGQGRLFGMPMTRSMFEARHPGDARSAASA